MSMSSLSTELIIKILEFVNTGRSAERHASLRSFALVARSYAVIAQVELYRTVSLGYRRNRAILPQKYFNIISSYPHIALYTKELRLYEGALQSEITPLILPLLPMVTAIQFGGGPACEGLYWMEISSSVQSAIQGAIKTYVFEEIRFFALWDMPVSLLVFLKSKSVRTIQIKDSTFWIPDTFPDDGLLALVAPEVFISRFSDKGQTENTRFLVSELDGERPAAISLKKLSVLYISYVLLHETMATISEIFKNCWNTLQVLTIRAPYVDYRFKPTHPSLGALVSLKRLVITCMVVPNDEDRPLGSRHWIDPLQDNFLPLLESVSNEIELEDMELIIESPLGHYEGILKIGQWSWEELDEVLSSPGPFSSLKRLEICIDSKYDNTPEPERIKAFIENTGLSRTSEKGVLNAKTGDMRDHLRYLI